MNEFDYDVYLKKRIAHMAKHRRGGSKSKKCPLSTDYMTRRQWEKRNGAVMTYQLNEPMDWAEFKSAPITIQREYIQHLIDTYNVNASSLAQMFGVHPTTVKSLLDANGIAVSFHVGKRMTPREKEVWNSFLGAGDCPPGSDESSYAPAAAPPACDGPTIQESGMAMNRFSMTFSGKIDVNMIANSILGMIGQDAAGTIEVVCTLDPPT